MSVPELDTITITDFRSIRGTLAVPLTAPVVLIHGTNGAGKSTVMSALELTLTGQVTGVDDAEREHMVHRGAERGQIDLKTSDGTVHFDLEKDRIQGKPLLDSANARFFIERCYLAQRTLGRLLELYERPSDTGESPLTVFVKELLQLDELDALLDGLHPVGHKRRVERLVPEYVEAERDLEHHRGREQALADELSETARRLEDSRTDMRQQLVRLDAPPSVIENVDATVRWLAQAGADAAIVDLVGARRELLAMARRVAEVSQSAEAKEVGALEATANDARAAAEGWRGSHGMPLEKLLDELRTDIPSIPAAGAGDPEAIRKDALKGIRTEVDRVSAAVAADDIALSESARLNAAVEVTHARVMSIDKQLAESGTATAAEDLGKVLAALVPHVHTEDCPVCGRDYAEVSGGPLSAHLAKRVSELAERADRLQALAKARLDAITDLRRLQDERRAFTERRLEPPAKVEMQAALARLEYAQGQLDELAPGLADGAELIRRATETERDLALARERDRASAELRGSVTELAVKLGHPVKQRAPLGEAVNALTEYVAGEISRLEAHAATRESARRTLAEVVRLEATRHELETARVRAAATADRFSAAIAELDRRRNVMKEVRRQTETARDAIVRHVFTSSLNRVWRELFVRLAPEEPFVPVFRVPDSGRGPVVARLETVHRDGKPGGSPETMLSSGNLNTAALTLFLALNLSVDRRLPWILLDDPVQSMDEVHVSQFAALLRTLSKEHGLRIVIAVHERALFDYLALELSPARPEDGLITVELNRSPDGVTLMQPGFKEYTEDRALEVV